MLLLEIISGHSVVEYDLEHGEHYLVEKVNFLSILTTLELRLPKSIQNHLKFTKIQETYTFCFTNHMILYCYKREQLQRILYLFGKE